VVVKLAGNRELALVDGGRVVRRLIPDPSLGHVFYPVAIDNRIVAFKWIRAEGQELWTVDVDSGILRRIGTAAGLRPLEVVGPGGPLLAQRGNDVVAIDLATNNATVWLTFPGDEELTTVAVDPPRRRAVGAIDDSRNDIWVLRPPPATAASLH
jgi:hypothetical protein